MADPFKLIRVPSLKSPAALRDHLLSLGLELPCDDMILVGSESPLARPILQVPINGKTIGNRWAVHPMEGWDATTTGAPTDEVRRRWSRFGESGAKLVFGGEAMAIVPEGRANPHQLVLNSENVQAIGELRKLLVDSHQRHHGETADLLVGFQLTHSGRFCRPTDKKRLEPRVAYRHPILDSKFGIQSDEAVLRDEEVDELIVQYVKAAGLAAEAGADFVDIKHCHGYLLHEFLGAHTRPGKYGGSFENRTRILCEIVKGIRESGNPIEIAVRLSAFDSVPFRPDPQLSAPGKPGPGIPEDFSHCLPYRYGFGVLASNPVKADLSETFAFVELCATLGIRLLNLTAGSPYYNPHLQRPAAYPPSDGYQPAHDPLIDVVRQIQTVRSVRLRAPAKMIIVGTGYTYLQEFLPHVAQAVIREGWVDSVGLGRMMLSYPTLLSDAVRNGVLVNKTICRTFSDCTTAPRNGWLSGCFPLDRYYAEKPEAEALKQWKRGSPKLPDPS